MESCKKRWIKFMIGDFLTIKITDKITYKYTTGGHKW